MNASLMLQLQRHWLVLSPVERGPHCLFVLLVAHYCGKGPIFRCHAFDLIWDIICLLCFHSTVGAKVNHWVLASLVDWLLILGSSLGWLLILLVEQCFMVTAVAELGLQCEWWFWAVFKCYSHHVALQDVWTYLFSVTRWREGDSMSRANF